MRAVVFEGVSVEGFRTVSSPSVVCVARRHDVFGMMRVVAVLRLSGFPHSRQPVPLPVSALRRFIPAAAPRGFRSSPFRFPTLHDREGREGTEFRPCQTGTSGSRSLGQALAFEVNCGSGHDDRWEVLRKVCSRGCERARPARRSLWPRFGAPEVEDPQCRFLRVRRVGWQGGRNLEGSVGLLRNVVWRESEAEGV